MRRVILLGIIWSIAGLFIASGVSAAPAAGEVSSRLTDVLRAPIDFFASLSRLAGSPGRIAQLELENESLRAQLFTIEQQPQSVETDVFQFITAKVHSGYPFNSYSRITVNAGTEHGISVGAPATVGGYLFIGRVIEVRERVSVIQTVFDPGFELPVQIGDELVDALYLGGRSPRLTMLVDDQDILPGAAVFTAADDLPYGLTVGSVAAVAATPGSVFSETAVSIPYDLASVHEVFIISR